MWTVFFFFFNSSLNLLQRCFCVMLWFFGHKSCEILAPQLGIKPSPPTLESEVITPGLPEQSLAYSLDCLLPTSLAIFCLVNSYSSFRTRFPGPSDGALCSGAGRAPHALRLSHASPHTHAEGPRLGFLALPAAGQIVGGKCQCSVDSECLVPKRSLTHHSISESKLQVP